jgi:hypothetical protein
LANSTSPVYHGGRPPARCLALFPPCASNSQTTTFAGGPEALQPVPAAPGVRVRRGRPARAAAAARCRGRRAGSDPRPAHRLCRARAGDAVGSLFSRAGRSRPNARHGLRTADPPAGPALRHAPEGASAGTNAACKINRMHEPAESLRDRRCSSPPPSRRVRRPHTRNMLRLLETDSG